ncbi:glycosyltransferase [Candidatus Pacearchaeota archaeon]|nr:glycosyltransferase [Candidatus Pacearchaeota archaeon]
MKLSIVIPAHNEEKRIAKTLESYSSYFESLRVKKKLDYEILVVINATKDRTEAIIKSYSKKNSRIQSINLQRGGKGYAVIEGCKEVLKKKNDVIGFVDADMATSPESFYALLEALPGHDGVIASRYLAGAHVSPKPKAERIFVSRVFNVIIRALFLMPYRDTQCGAKVFTAEAVKDVIPRLGMTRWAFDVELLYTMRKQGYTIKEVPTTWSDKKYSTINFKKAGPWMGLAILRLRILHSPFKRFIKIYDSLLSRLQ